jgi:Secretion system C-terminal sorting domain
MRILRLLLCAAFLPPALLAQPNFITSLYPTQHALNVPADAELRVGLQAPLDPASFSDSSIYVWSDITGLHKLTVTLENGNKDLRIVPRHWYLNDRPPFNAGERVTVTLTTRLRYADGRPFEGFTWHYTVAVRQFRGGDFSPLAIFGGGGSTYFYVSDFNGDGWCDLIGDDDGVERKMIIFLNDGKGVLQFSHKDNIISPSGETADLNLDGNQDITTRGDRIVLNDGTAHFTEKAFPDRPFTFAKAYDFNVDGIIDFAMGNVLSDTLYFGLSVNRESFKKLQKVLAPIRRPIFYMYGISYDLDNDGRIDFLYGGGSTVEKIDPGFASFQATTGDSLRLLQVFKGLIGEFYGNDLDEDGDLDYIFVNGDAVRNSYLTFFNDGSGQLIPIVPQQSNPTLANTVEGGDFDGDGDIDLAIPRSNLVSVFPERYAPDISILLNDGKGNFTLASRVRLPFDRSLSRMLRAVDLDRDGDLDLIGVANGLFYVVANGAYPNAVAHRLPLSIPMQFTIKPIYPNPTQNRAKIELVLAEVSKEEIIVTLYDTTGRLIRSWRLNGREQTIRFNWDTQDQNSNLVPSGVYFVRAQMGQLRAVQKILVLR